MIIGKAIVSERALLDTDGKRSNAQLSHRVDKEGAKASGAIEDWHYNTSLCDYR